MNQGARSRLGFWSIVLLGINAVIGSGIFLLPGKAMDLVGPGSIFVYLFMTAAVMAIALCFAECAGRFSRNGAAYVYAREAFGTFLGFEVGLMGWAIRIIAWAAMAVGFVTALGAVWPPALLAPYRTLLILGILLGLSALNLLGVRPAKLVNNLVTLGKLLPLLVFILLGTWFIQGSRFAPLFPKGFQLDAFGAAAIVIFYAFTGFESLAVAAEDLDNPRENVPRALLVVMGTCSLIYLAVQTIAVGTLGPALAGSTTPVADAAASFLGPGGKWLVTLGALISIGGINVAASFITPRTAVALAEDGLLPRPFARMSRFGTPPLAILVTVLLAIPVALSGTFAQLAAISVVSRFAQYLPTCLAVLVLRRRQPAPGFQLPFGPVIPLLAAAICLWLLSQASRTQLAWGLGALAIGAVLYLFTKVLAQKTAPSTETPVPSTLPEVQQ